MTISTLDYAAEIRVPYWANFAVIIHAEDGKHVKFYQGFPNAEREFMNQVGHPPANYMRDKVGDQRWADLNRESPWTLQRQIQHQGSFEAIDDYGRRVAVMSVKGYEFVV